MSQYRGFNKTCLSCRSFSHFLECGEIFFFHLSYKSQPNDIKVGLFGGDFSVDISIHLNYISLLFSQSSYLGLDK